jgi:arginine decarboxylase
MVPTKIFYTRGVGVHKEKLASFEMALRVAGLAHCNLVLVSSIYPPACKTISKEEGLKLLRRGEIVFAVYDRESTNEPNRLVAASVGLAIPADSSMHGYLSEHHSFGETDERAGEYAEDLAASMLATTLGIEFDPELDWDEREHLFKMSEKIVRTSNITQSAVGNKDGLWTTVFAAAVFINDDYASAEIAQSQGNETRGIQDESSKQISQSSNDSSQSHEAARRNNIHATYQPRPIPNHGQQEITKALHRSLRTKEESSPQEKGSLTIGQSSNPKIGRLKVPKPL